MYKFFIEVEREARGEVYALLKEQNVEYRRILRKAADIPQLIMVTAAALFIFDTLQRWYKTRKQTEPELKVKIYRYDEKKPSDPGEEITNWETKSVTEIEMEIKKE